MPVKSQPNGNSSATHQLRDAARELPSHLLAPNNKLTGQFGERKEEKQVNKSTRGKTNKQKGFGFFFQERDVKVEEAQSAQNICRFSMTVCHKIKTIFLKI